jgi:hypothetical protein
MRTKPAILAALLACSATALARPFETQAQVEARLGGRFCNGAETSDYKVIAYSTDDLMVWVLYMNGLSEGEMYFRNGPMPDMEVATFLESNKGQSIWQVEKIEGTDKETSAKAWNRKDGKLYAFLASKPNQSIFLIGTKKAQRIMGDMGKMEAFLKPRDRIQ